MNMSSCQVCGGHEESNEQGELVGGMHDVRFHDLLDRIENLELALAKATSSVSATDTGPRPKFGPDGAITNLDELPQPEPQEYHWCKGCGHEFRVHYLGGACHGFKFTFSGEPGDERPCRCERFVPRPESVPESSADLDARRLPSRVVDAVEYAWTIIANAYGGDWSKAPKDWREAAEKWRDEDMAFVMSEPLTIPGRASPDATDDTDDPRHITEFRVGGWSIQHPRSCRPNLLDCRLHEVVSQEMDDWKGEGAPYPVGLYITTLDRAYGESARYDGPYDELPPLPADDVTDVPKEVHAVVGGDQGKRDLGADSVPAFVPVRVHDEVCPDCGGKGTHFPRGDTTLEPVACTTCGGSGWLCEKGCDHRWPSECKNATMNAPCRCSCHAIPGLSDGYPSDGDLPDLWEYAHRKHHKCERNDPASCTGCFVRDVLGVFGDDPLPSSTYPGTDHDPEWVVTFEFVERDNAKAFVDDVMGWLNERVPAPRHFIEQATKDLVQKFGEPVTCPRYWLYEDASPSLGPVSVTASDTWDQAAVTDAWQKGYANGIADERKASSGSAPDEALDTARIVLKRYFTDDVHYDRTSLHEAMCALKDILWSDVSNTHTGGDDA